MNDAKYIGLDVHQATISPAVLDSSGNLGDSLSFPFVVVAFLVSAWR